MPKEVFDKSFGNHKGNVTFPEEELKIQANSTNVCDCNVACAQQHT